MADEIELHPPQTGWREKFAAEVAVIRPLFAAGALLDFQHIGSTAIAGIAAKPIIDMMALVSDLSHGRALVGPLAGRGYAFWADNPRSDRLFFVRGLPPAPQRSHHLHITADPQEMERHTLFRDHLNANPAERAAYEALKRDLAARFSDDREAYSQAKTQWVRAAEHRARSGSA
jgi:GrpB-like predicted nucleotidyltransferase (UPF0157 family)